MLIHFGRTWNTKITITSNDTLHRSIYMLMTKKIIFMESQRGFPLT